MEVGGERETQEESASNREVSGGGASTRENKPAAWTLRLSASTPQVQRAGAPESAGPWASTPLSDLRFCQPAAIEFSWDQCQRQAPYSSAQVVPELQLKTEAPSNVTARPRGPAAPAQPQGPAQTAQASPH